MDSVASLEQQIRGRINDSPIIFQCLRDDNLWGSVCSAMDMLGDAEIALDSWEASQGSDDLGMRYVTVFGVLQILVVQQEAAIQLCSALGVRPSSEDNADLVGIREIRNPSTGHPVLRRDGSSHHLTRATLSTHGFQMASYWPDGRSEYRDVNLRELVTKQRRLLIPLLKQALQKAIAMENDHRRRFRSDKLGLKINDYLLQNLWQAVHDADRAPMGIPTIGMVRDNIAAFEKGLIARIPTSPLTHELPSIRHALDRLEGYFRLSTPSDVDRADADVFVSHAVDRLRHLREIADLIDSRFERDVA